MKNLLLLIVVLLLGASHAFSQAEGQWSGTLSVQGTKLRVVFNVKKMPAGYESTMDSPDQQARNIPVSRTLLKNDTLTLEIPAARIIYTGRMKKDSLAGTFKQGTFSTPLNLARTKTNVTSSRPQEPVKPYPYYSEDVMFPSVAGVTIAGTLTLPGATGKYPVVVLISGSGPQNRDSEIFGHKPFLILADYLTRKGIGVLRYDDRGVGESTGNFSAATTQDFANDATAAINFLKRHHAVQSNNIGLIGHSEGGIIAPMVASSSKDVAFVVLLAGSGLRGSDLMLLQKKRIEENMGVDPVSITNSQQIFRTLYDQITATDTTAFKQRVRKILDDAYGKAIPPAQLKAIYDQLTTPWMISFLRHDPLPFLKKVKVPVLVLNGDRDLQVPSAENTSAIEQALRSGGNKAITVKRYPTLNHLFQESTSGSITEYATIDQTFYPVALEDIVIFIKSNTQK